MSDRLGALVEREAAAGRFVTCEASLLETLKGGEDIIEVRLHAEEPGGSP
jgi:hypothetical protein